MKTNDMSIPQSAALRMTLVNPPFQYFPGIDIKKDNYTRPPLGIAYLASYLMKHYPGIIDIRLIDCEAEDFSTKGEVVARILSNRPHIVGFLTVTGGWLSVSELAGSVKGLLPSVVTIAGGPHITALPEEHIPGIDVNIFGEGEISLTEYLIKRAEGGAIGDIPGCIQFEGNDIVSRGPARPLIGDIDVIPIPARELLRRDAYFHSYPYRGARNFTTLFTARGCPYNCNFCGNEAIWGGRIRYHSLDRIFEEIGLIARQGTTLVFIDDDTFTSNKARVLKICDHISRRHPRLKWICHARADTVDAEMISAMKRAGCVEAQIGVESGDPEVLRNTDKALTIDNVRTAFSLFHEHGINCWATFILGNSGDSPKTIARSIAFAKEIDPTYCSFIVLLPFPGTRIFKEYKRKGFIKTYDWSRYSWHGPPVISTDTISDKELAYWRRRAYLHFYLRPKKLFQTAMNIAGAMSMREIMRNFRAWRVLVSRG